MSGRETGMADFLWGLIHELQIEIIEALRVIDEPLSPSELEKVFEDRTPLSNIAYHCRRLTDLKVLRVVRTQPVRGAVQHFYFFRDDAAWLKDA